MLKKLVTGILSLALCASALTALPRPAYADEPEEPTPIVIVEPEEPEEPGEPIEPEEPDEPEEPEEPEEPGEPACVCELPLDEETAMDAQ